MLFREREGGYDTWVTASDWRYSAAIVGLCKYFEQFHIPHCIGDVFVEELGFADEALQFNYEELQEERYLNFVEKFYGAQLQHVELENLLHKASPLTEEEVKRVNDLLNGQAANTTLKKVFGKEKFSEDRRPEVLETISAQRPLLIKETFRNKKNMYAAFANVNALGNEGGEICRLSGYYVDLPKKGKSLGYGFDKAAFRGQDTKLFDFIPFAFYGGRDKFFVNSNAYIGQTIAYDGMEAEEKGLLAVDRLLQREVRQRREADAEKKTWTQERHLLWGVLNHLCEYKSGSVEIILKSQDKDVFESCYIRDCSLAILKELKKQNSKDGRPRYETFNRVFSPDGGKNYVDIHEITLDSILRLVSLDTWLEYVLKQIVKGQESLGYVVREWVWINHMILNGGDKMQKMIWVAKEEGAKVRAYFQKESRNDRKLKAYQAKFVSSLNTHNYDKVCETLLQLSNYTGIHFSFAGPLYADFEANKNLMYAFIGELVLGSSIPEKTEAKD